MLPVFGADMTHSHLIDVPLSGIFAWHCSALSWFAVACYYFCIRQLDQARRYFW